MEMEQKNNIADKVAKQNLNDLQIMPPAMTFDKVRRKVAWFSFWTLGVGSFVRHYWWTAATALVLSFFFINLPKNTTSNAEICILGNKHIPEFELKENNHASEFIQQTQNSNVNGPAFFVNNDNPKINLKTKTNIAQYYVQEVNNNQINQIDQAQINNVAQVDLSKQNLLSDTDVQFEALKFMPVLKADLLVYEASNDVKTIHKSILAKKNINFSVFVGFGAGLSSPFSTFDSESDFSRRLNPFENTIAELKINADFGSFFLSSGIKYVTFNDRFQEKDLLYNQHEEWNSELQQYWQVDTSSYWQYYYMSDSIIHIIDSVWVTEVDSTLIDDYILTIRDGYDTIPNAKWQRTICVAELPIMIGKQFTFKNSAFSVSTGLGFALLITSKGEIYNGPNSVEAFSTYSTESKNIAVSLLLDVSYEYFIDEHISLQVMPYFRKSLNTMISSPESNMLKPWSVGVSGGFRYYF